MTRRTPSGSCDHLVSACVLCGCFCSSCTCDARLHRTHAHSPSLQAHREELLKLCSNPTASGAPALNPHQECKQRHTRMQAAAARPPRSGVRLLRCTTPLTTFHTASKTAALPSRPLRPVRASPPHRSVRAAKRGKRAMRSRVPAESADETQHAGDAAEIFRHGARAGVARGGCRTLPAATQKS